VKWVIVTVFMGLATYFVDFFVVIYNGAIFDYGYQTLFGIVT
jgi:hypothetical protein